MRLHRRLYERLSLRLERRWLQLRAIRKGRELTPVRDRTDGMRPGPILFSTLRNEAVRLPWFLHHYRELGVAHFLFVDNGSTDGSLELLKSESDVSVWHTDASYKQSRFGVDWLNALLRRHGNGRWVIVADPDELLVYPHHDTRKLPALTRWLELQGRESFATILLDIYGDQPISETAIAPGHDPIMVTPWFDAYNYSQYRNSRYHNIWIQGGPRQRVHFLTRPWDAPALNKVPLVRWQNSFVLRNSTHNLLPRRLNRAFTHRGGALTSGVLLHTKFSNVLETKVAEEMQRRQHYDNSAEYRAYAARGGDVCLWTPQSMRYVGWRQLCALGLMSEGSWL